MEESVLFSRNGELVRVPRAEWEADLAHAPEAGRKRLAFMTTEHHRVRELVVRELPRHGKALTAQEITTMLDLPPVRVAAILDDLERHLFFLVRRPEEAVSWAFPVTVEETPHRLVFSSGERCFAA